MTPRQKWLRRSGRGRRRHSPRSRTLLTCGSANISDNYLSLVFLRRLSAVCDIIVHKTSYLLSHFLQCRNCICMMVLYGVNYGKGVYAKYLFSFVGEGSISLFGDDDYMSYVNATARHRRTLNCQLSQSASQSVVPSLCFTPSVHSSYWLNKDYGM